MIKKLGYGILFAVLLLVGVLLFNTFRLKSSKPVFEKIAPTKIADGAVGHFAEAIALRTISFADPADVDTTQFAQFNAFLLDSYPLLTTRLESTTFSTYSHLYKWQGSDPTLKPIILMAHLDVVPIASPSLWSVHPFTEGIKGDTIYGRGAIDDKFSLVAILEAVEQLLSLAYLPQRTIYISIGHDEEVSGKNGAQKIVDYLKSQNVEAEFILDEGMAMVEGMIPGVNRKVALIGLAEKGYASYELSVAMVGGHSSTPENETSIDVLSKAIARLKDNPLPAHITPALRGFMDQVGPEMDFLKRLAFANTWLFKPLIVNAYEQSGATNAMVRTTTAPTIFEAGVKENVIPTVARATVNFRILPGETMVDVKAHLINTIDDERIQIEQLSIAANPSPISPTNSLGYAVIQQSILEIYPDLLAAPSLVLGATDARHFTEISDNIYRFVPYTINKHNMHCYHGIDERVPIDEFENGIRFYQRVIKNSSGN